MTLNGTIKPGWHTTEFWVVLIGKVFSVLVTLGVLSASAGADLGTAAANAAVGISAILALLGMVKHYVAARTTAKNLAVLATKNLAALATLPTTPGPTER